MRRMALFWIAIVLTACGGATATPAPESTATGVAQALVSPTVVASPTVEQPSATPTSVASPTRVASPTAAATETPAKPAPTALPTQPIDPEITAKPAELDTPNLTDVNAPPTPEPQPAPNAASDPLQPVRLVIDAVGINAEPVSVGLDARNVPVVPRHDVGWYNLSARPGQGENVVFWGHVLRWRDTPKVPAPFATLKDTKIGDRLTVYTADGQQFSYTITQQVWVTPDQVQYILPVGSERITLVSCIGDKVVTEDGVEMTHRLITIAEP